MKCPNMLSTFFGKFCADIFFGTIEVTNNYFKCDTTWCRQSCVRHHDLMCDFFIKWTKENTCPLLWPIFSNKIIPNTRCMATFITCISFFFGIGLNLSNKIIQNTRCVINFITYSRVVLVFLCIGLIFSNKIILHVWRAAQSWNKQGKDMRPLMSLPWFKDLKSFSLFSS